MNGYFYAMCSFNQLHLPLRIAKSSGLHDLSFDLSLLAMARSIQFLASEMQAVRIHEERSKDAASAHKLSCISLDIFLSSVAKVLKHIYKLYNYQDLQQIVEFTCIDNIYYKSKEAEKYQQKEGAVPGDLKSSHFRLPSCELHQKSVCCHSI